MVGLGGRRQVDPTRLEVGADLRTHQAKLRMACASLLRAILGARPAMPAPMVAVCRMLHREVERRYPGSGGRAVGTRRTFFVSHRRDCRWGPSYLPWRRGGL
jgi:hypothetical protein